MQSVTYVGLPQVHICLFTAVQNAATLQSRLKTAATATGAQGEVERETMNFAFVNAALVRSFAFFPAPFVNESKADSQPAASSHRHIPGFISTRSRQPSHEDCAL
jgi:EKC/KEOPS complex subunit CGI121/TPRKB